MKILASFAAVAVLLLAVASPAPAAHKGYESCGDQTTPTQGAPYTNLKADNVSCKGAHKVADRYVKQPFTNGYKGWACDAKQVGAEELKVSCGRDKKGKTQRLKFFWGA
jgi:hypothetical protein